MKKLFTTTIIIVLLSTTCYAKTSNDYLQQLEYIDNQLFVLIKLIVENDYKDIKPIEKDLIFLESLLSSLGNDVDTDYKRAKTLNEKNFILNVDNTSNDFELATINIRRYYDKNKDGETFLAITNDYNVGHLRLLYLLNQMKKG